MIRPNICNGEIIKDQFDQICFEAFGNYYVNGVLFKNINNNLDGAAVYCETIDSKLLVCSALFFTCKTTSNYGIIYSKSNYLEIEKSLFLKCSSSYATCIYAAGTQNGKYVISQNEVILNSGEMDFYLVSASNYEYTLNFSKENNENTQYALHYPRNPLLTSIKYINILCNKQKTVPIALSSKNPSNSVVVSHVVIIENREYHVFFVHTCHAVLDHISTVHCQCILAKNEMDGHATFKNSYIGPDVTIDTAICTLDEASKSNRRDGTEFPVHLNRFFYPKRRSHLRLGRKLPICFLLFTVFSLTVNNILL